MRIKVFKAPTMKDAMANVKAELGDDAVILHTKRYRKGGLMGFRSKEIVEIPAEAPKGVSIFQAQLAVLRIISRRNLLLLSL